jgi:hypothetical protein
VPLDLQGARRYGHLGRYSPLVFAQLFYFFNRRSRILDLFVSRTSLLLGFPAFVCMELHLKLYARCSLSPLAVDAFVLIRIPAWPSLNEIVSRHLQLREASVYTYRVIVKVKYESVSDSVGDAIY